MKYSIGELIDRLSIVNIKIWNATVKAHEAYNEKKHKETNELLKKLEVMNVQRKEIISDINVFFKQKKDYLLEKTYKKITK